MGAAHHIRLVTKPQREVEEAGLVGVRRSLAIRPITTGHP